MLNIEVRNFGVRHSIFIIRHLISAGYEDLKLDCAEAKVSPTGGDLVGA